MKLERKAAFPPKITKSTPDANTSNQRFNPAPLASARQLLCCGFLLTLGFLPGVAQAEVRNSLTIQLFENVFEVRASTARSGRTVLHHFAVFDLDTSVLASDFIRPWRERAGGSVRAAFSVAVSDGERVGEPRFAIFDERFKRLRSGFDPCDRLKIRPRPDPTQPIPEPHAALLFVAGIGILVWSTRRRH